MQRRQNRLALLYSVRDRQFELVKLALDNPQFLYIESPDVISDTTAKMKVYANLMVGHWALLWDLGILRDHTLHALAARLFTTAITRDWWATWGNSYLDYRPRRFFEIMSIECRKAQLAAASSASADDLEPTETYQFDPSGHERSLVGSAQGAKKRTGTDTVPRSAAMLIGAIALGVAVGFGGRRLLKIRAKAQVPGRSPNVLGSHNG